jgi:hypothetical protein
MPIQILAREGGAPIGSPDEWLQHAPPKGGASQWREGRSALELARAWCASAVPPEVTQLLESHPDLCGTEIDQAYPEQRIRFDRLRGEPRNADLVTVGWRGGERVAISVEGKADEPFDRTVTAVRAAVDRKLARGEASRGNERVVGLLDALLPESARGGADSLRYQLLTAAAGALAYAFDQSADRAVLVVHEFVRDARSANVRRNAQDLDAFVAMVTGAPGAALLPGQIAGPIRVPGSDMIPGHIPLYIGKARRQIPG